MNDKLRYQGTQIVPLLKEAIQGFETLENRSEEDKKVLKSLLNRDTLGPIEFYDHPEKEKFFTILKHPFSGLSLTNISEQMLLQGPKIDTKHTSFWFVAGLKFHENNSTELLARHLTLLAIFYHSQGRTMIAEGLLSRALDITKGENNEHRAFTMKIYGQILAMKGNRNTESRKYINEGRAIEGSHVPWAGKLTQVHIPMIE